jgi:dihydropteroate synthase
MSHPLQAGRHALDLARPRVMGILNVTPDSFSDGGRFHDRDRAIAHARAMLADGADMIDVGGESTRPGAAPVGEAEELDRVVPVIEALARDGAIVSVDTMKPAVMRAALAAGASMVNDVRALREPGALEAVAQGGAAVCLMHMRGTPASMQQGPQYDDVVDEVAAFLRGRDAAVTEGGVAPERVVLDPGIGFGKSVAHNIELLRRQRELLALGRPLLVGWSRKSTLGAITGRDVAQRQFASVAAALAAVQSGARIVRVHDVAATVDALRVWQAAGLGQG